MKYLKKKYFVVIVTFLNLFSINAYSLSPWDEFLKQPNNHGLEKLEKSLGDIARHCDWDNPINQSIVPSDDEFSQLLKIIRKGNESAFRAALIVLKCWDSGNIEDIYRSGGIFFDVNTRAFLKIVKEKEIPDSSLSDFLIMLPLYTVDNVELKIAVVKKRIDLLNSVSDEIFNDIKRKGLSFLEKEKKDLIRMK